MSTRFVIKNTAGKADREGDIIIRYTGTSEPFVRVSERDGTAVGIDKDGNKKLVYTTGLDPDRVDFYKWYNDEEKKAVTKQIKDLRPIIVKSYGGEEVVDSTNQFFWGKTRDVSRLSLTNADMDVFYDTKNPVHALLYCSIMAGAFIDLVAPTRDWAERHQTPHYMALETEEVLEDDDEITRSDAHALLSELRKEESGDALFILAWCAQYDTNAFGGINKSTPIKSLITSHAQFIDGKLVTKRKRNTPKVFIDYAEKWKGQQTRPALFVEAYVRAGEYFSFINQREKKFVMTDGTVLGSTVADAVSTLMKPKFTQDLEKLRKQVEDKWKE